MKRRILYLHVGPSKTGTSAVQGLLRSRPPRGLTYPLTGQWNDGAHHYLVWSLAGLKKRGHQLIPSFNRIYSKLIKEMEEAPGDVIISSEAFNPNNTGPIFFQQFSAKLEELGLEPVILIAIRNPLSRISSAYNQAVKDPVRAETRLPDTFIDEQWASYRMLPLIDAWKRICNRVVPIAYSPDSSFVQRFIKLVSSGSDRWGITNAKEDAGEFWPNRSMSLPALLVMLAVNRSIAPPESRAAIFERMCREAPEFVWRGETFPFSTAASREYYERLKPDLDALRDLYSIDVDYGQAAMGRSTSISADDYTAILRFVSLVPSALSSLREFEDLLPSVRTL